MSLPTLTSENFKEKVIDFHGTILVDFGAEWCGPCKMIKPVLEEVYTKGFNVAYVDIDASPKLAKKYKVTSVPTMVVFVDGEEKSRFVGLIPKSKIEKALED